MKLPVFFQPNLELARPRQPISLWSHFLNGMGKSIQSGDGRVTSCGFCLDYRDGGDPGPRGEVVAPGSLGHL